MHVILLIIAGLVLWPFLHRSKGGIKGKVICRNCGSAERPVIVSPSNFFIEVLLWCAGLVPGVLYTLWCSHVSYSACARCGARDIVPVDSPVGRKLTLQHSADVTPMSEQSGRK